MATPALKIEGMPVTAGRYGEHAWPQTMGLQPPQVIWRLPADVAAVVLAKNETTIELTPPGGKTTKFQRVVVVKEIPTEHEKIRAVLLSDVRWYLLRVWLRRSYNVRIASGTGRVLSVGGLPQETLPIVSNLIFAPFSLKGADDGTGVPFTVEDIMDDLLDAATKARDFAAIKVKRLARARTGFTPNDVYVDARADVALGQVLGGMGGMDFRVALDGTLELVDAFMGAEKALLDPVVKAYSLAWKGRLRFVSMSHVAPRKINVLVNRRVEVRGDALESNTQPKPGNEPTLRNVIRVTDLTLPYPSAQQPSVAGTFLEADNYLTGVAAKADQPAGRQKLTREILLTGLGGGKGASLLLSNLLELLYATDPKTGEPNVLWQSRCSAIRTDLRRTYKLNPVFARQCAPGSIRAERVALLDPATGTRQPATVYQDYFIRPQFRSIAAGTRFAFNMNCIPGSPNGQDFPGNIKTYTNDTFPSSPFPLSAATPAPFDVRVLDPTNGIFHFEPRPDLSGKRTGEVIPSLVSNIPVVSAFQVASGGAIAYMEQARLVTSHRVALVFSAVPAGPNNEAQLHKYVITADAALVRLGVTPASVTPQGPDMDLRVGPSVAEALVPWRDADRSALLGCFSKTGTTDPSKLLPVNDAELNAYATAIASVYMAAILDRYEGNASIGFRPDLAPVGSLRSVVHTVMADGRIYTTLDCQGAAVPLQPEALMSQHARNVLFRNLA